MLTPQELATVLAALRFYQQQGLGDAVHRPDVIHDIATDCDTLAALDDEGIDALCLRLGQSDYPG